MPWRVERYERIVTVCASVRLLGKVYKMMRLFPKATLGSGGHAAEIRYGFRG